jgi:L-lactate utilization protein LutB
VRDEAVLGDNGGGEYERIRCWDSCAGTVYRRIAGGHNPRQAKGDRLRNRFYCKFYYYPEQYGPMACTGCGRCIDSCPVNIDITEVISHLAQLAVES